MEGFAEDDRGQVWDGRHVLLPLPQVVIPLQHPHVPRHRVLRGHPAARLADQGRPLGRLHREQRQLHGHRAAHRRGTAHFVK